MMFLANVDEKALKIIHYLDELIAYADAKSKCPVVTCLCKDRI